MIKCLVEKETKMCHFFMEPAYIKSTLIWHTVFGFHGDSNPGPLTCKTGDITATPPWLLMQVIATEINFNIIWIIFLQFYQQRFAPSLALVWESWNFHGSCMIHIPYLLYSLWPYVSQMVARQNRKSLNAKPNERSSADSLSGKGLYQ